MKKLLYFTILSIVFIFTSCESNNIDTVLSSIQSNGIYISTSVSSANSVGGRNIKYIIKNNSGKVIKYVNIDVILLNNFNDKVYCEVRDSYNFGIRLVGPIYNNHTSEYVSQDLFYNYTASKTHISYCQIEFIDGTKIKIIK
jgi:hypothetical protein